MSNIPFKKGDKVQVSNGVQEPPKHHRRKHGAWRVHNFTGWVRHVESDGSLAVDETGKGCMCIVIRPWDKKVTLLND